jgi:hypothetical protein
LHQSAVLDAKTNKCSLQHRQLAIRIRKEPAGGAASIVAHDGDWEIFNKFRWDAPLPSTAGHLPFTCIPKAT